MIELSDPLVIAAGVLAALLLVLIVLGSAAMRRAGRSARDTERVLAQIGGLGGRVQSLADGQQQLFGGLTSVTEAQAQQQAQTLQLMELRLAEVTRQMQENLQGSATRTARSVACSARNSPTRSITPASERTA